jgi:manganese-dependent ADP-ribose/CDP-alcohol diphosphatase
MRTTALFWVLLSFAATAQTPRRERALPLFSFAVLTDIQYGDQETMGRREYRRSLAKLEECVKALNARDTAFTVQLGDIVDSRSEDLPAILSVFNEIRGPKYHVLGNHDFCVNRAALLKSLGLAAGYYDFVYSGWRFVVLDGMDVSVEGGWPKDSANYQIGQAMLSELRQKKQENAMLWNGAVGEQQKAWLRRTLQAAAKKRERVIVLCHFPLLKESSTAAHLLWNHEEIRNILQESGVVAACFSGHDHRGGYAERDGIHYVTFPGMVESQNENSYTVVNVYPNRLELEGAGSAPSRTLQLSTGPVSR